MSKHWLQSDVNSVFTLLGFILVGAEDLFARSTSYLGQSSPGCSRSLCQGQEVGKLSSVPDILLGFWFTLVYTLPP